MTDTIPFGSPRIGDREVAAVEAQLRSGDLSTGDVVGEFEAECAALAGRDHAAAVASGSVALELALEVADIDNGAGVVVSPYNCGAVLFSVLRTGAVPVFANLDPGTYGLDPGATVEAIEAADVRVDAILPVHLYGLPCKVDALERIATDRNLVLVEDFAQAPGARRDGRPAGSFGEVGVASFGATKNVTTAEGGVVVSDDRSLVEAVEARRSSAGGVTDVVPRSVRMNDVEAAIGCEQLSKYDEILDAKRTAARIYDDRLPDDLVLPPTADDATHVYHGYPVLTDRRDELADFLAGRGIESAAVYDTPLHEYPQVDPPSHDSSETFPESRRVADRVLLVPIHGSITAEDAHTVADAVVDFFA